MSFFCCVFNRWSYQPDDARNPLKCEHTFSSGRDAIYDAKWCPVPTYDNDMNTNFMDNSNSASSDKDNSTSTNEKSNNKASTSMFATVGGEGHLSLWDLEKEMETSISSIDVGEALNKCKWNASGSYIAVGGVSGKTYVYKNTTRSGSGTNKVVDK